MLEKNHEIWKTKPQVVILIISFLIWAFLFQGFLLNKYSLNGDAAIYYEHTKFFLDHIREGIYPLWEPNRNFGNPTEFFMRRIGEFNPFYSIIIILDTLGLSYTQSYLCFLALYFFLGLIGFYLLTLHLLKDRSIALMSFWLLLFSSLGTQLFCSFIILIFVPIVWFFYFLVSFSDSPKKYSFLGMLFCLMLILSTYIPFYFLTIILWFLICFCALYFKNLKQLFSRYLRFFIEHKVFTIICIIILVISFIPGVMFYQETQQGDITLPHRSSKAPIKNAIAVSIQRGYDGGIIPPAIFDELFSNLKDFSLGHFFVPTVACLIFLLGLVVSSNRRMILLSLWGLGLFLIGLSYATPIYPFLYKHLFYFKYFRNLEFLLWIFILPVGILLLMEQFKKFLDYKPKKKWHKKAFLVFICFVHIYFIWFLRQQDNVLMSAYIVVILSLILLILYFLSSFYKIHILGNISTKNITYFILLASIILIQPLHVYPNVTKKHSILSIEDPYRYDRPYLDLKLPKDDETLHTVLKSRKKQRKCADTNRPAFHMGVSWENHIRTNLSSVVLEQYLYSRLSLYDHVEHMPDEETDFERLGKTFNKNENLAFISTEDDPSLNQNKLPPNRTKKHPKIISQSSPEVEVLEFTTNTLKLKTKLTADKFLVYNDTYHKKWQVFIDGQRTKLWRANFAFKGTWIPKGEHIVLFRYGSLWLYGIKYFLLFLFNIVLFVTIYLFLQDRKQGHSLAKNN